MWPNPQETTDLVTFTEEILNRFLCSDIAVTPGNSNFKGSIGSIYKKKLIILKISITKIHPRSAFSKLICVSSLCFDTLHLEALHFQRQSCKPHYTVNATFAGKIFYLPPKATQIIK